MFRHHPEEKGAYELALTYAQKENADIILVCDPDADRMGVGVLQKLKRFDFLHKHRIHHINRLIHRLRF